MSYSDDRKYTKEHEWILTEGGEAKIGVTKYAVEQLGDVVHLELPEVGAKFSAGESFGTVESTKTVSDLYLPVDGEIIAVNQELIDAPEELAEDPHDKGWLVRIRISGKTDELLDAAAYTQYVEEDAAQ